MRLTPENIDRFEAEGVLHPVSAITADEAAEGLGRLEAAEAARAGRLPPSLNAKPHLLLPWFWDLVHDPRIVDPVEDLLGPDLLCWGTSFISKKGRDGRYVSWHQDATHWGLSEPRAVTAWIALTASTRANGCVQMIPGSHRLIRPHADNRDPANLLGRREAVQDGAEIEAPAVDIELRPGEMSLHHVLVVHGSGPNPSSDRRVGFAIRYIPGHVQQRGKVPPSATLVRGRNHADFELERAPEGDFHPAALARHADVLRRGMGVIYADTDQT